MASHVSSILSVLCIGTLSAFAVHAESEPLPPPLSCLSDADCASDESCVKVVPLICQIDEDTGDCFSPEDSDVEGICTPLEVPEHDACLSDVDCPEGFYCEVPGATCDVVCQPDVGCELFCDEDAEPAEGHCVEATDVYASECFDDTDCQAGESCQYFDYAATEGTEDSPPYAAGLCLPTVGSDVCESDDDCGAGFRCELSPVSGSTEPDMDGAGDTISGDGDAPAYTGYCVEETLVFPYECEVDAHCGPEGYCTPEKICEYEWIVGPTDDLSCFADEDCGTGGFCVQPHFDCPVGAACMVPPTPVHGVCEYGDAPVDDEDCVVTVLDQCVVYAGNRGELSCEATSGAPTWLAFLAILGLVRRRRSRG